MLTADAGLPRLGLTMGRVALLPAGVTLGALAVGAGAALDPHLAFGAVVLTTLLVLVSVEPALLLPVALLVEASPTDHSPGMRAALLLALASVAAAWALARPSRSESTPSHLGPQVWRRVAVLAVGVLGVLVLQYVALSSYPQSVLVRGLQIAAAVVGTFALLVRARRMPLALRRAAWAVTGFGALEALLALAQQTLRRPLLVEERLSPEGLAAAYDIPGLLRAMGTYAHPNSLALTLVLVLPLPLWLAARSASPRPRLLGYAAAGLMVLGVAVTLSRSGVLAMAAMAAAWWVVARASRILVAGVVAAAAGALLLGLAAFVPTVGQTVDRFTGDSGVAASRDAGSGHARRANMWAALEAARARPVLGHGWGTTAEVGVHYGGYQGLGAHNTYLDVAQGGGLVLLTLVGGILLTWWRRLWGPLRREGSPLLLAFAALPVYGLFETILQGAWALVIGGLVVIAAHDRRPPERPAGAL